MQYRFVSQKLCRKHYFIKYYFSAVKCLTPDRSVGKIYIIGKIYSVGKIYIVTKIYFDAQKYSVVQKTKNAVG